MLPHPPTDEAPSSFPQHRPYLNARPAASADAVPRPWSLRGSPTSDGWTVGVVTTKEMGDSDELDCRGFNNGTRAPK